MPAESILLTTDKMYLCPEYKDFCTQKDDFIQREFGYQDSAQNVRWTTLMERFITSDKLSENQKQTFKAFKEDRLNTDSNNRFALSVEQSLDYFENFYFLYFNSSPLYTLSDKKKETLLNNLQAAMQTGICEAGKFTRFENALQHARTDISDWILTELARHRIMLVQTIADEYNSKNKVGDGFSIHTVMYMNGLAKQRGLGINKSNELDDVFITWVNQTEITAYFDKVYPIKFLQYEKDVVDNLAQHVMFEVSEWLKNHNVDLTNWDKCAVNMQLVTGDMLSRDYEMQLFERMKHFLGDEFNPNGFYDYDDDYDTYGPKAKGEFFAAIKQALRKKLVADQFFLPLAELTRNHDLIDMLRFPRDIRADDLLTFLDAMQADNGQMQQVEDLWQQNYNIIRLYPSLGTELFINHPGLWSKIPKSFRTDVDLVDDMMTTIESVYRAAQSEDKKNRIIEFLCLIARQNPDYLKQLPQSLLADKLFATKLVTKNGLLLSVLSDELQADSDIYKVAVAQNKSAEIFIKTEAQIKELLSKIKEFKKEIDKSVPEHLILWREVNEWCQYDADTSARKPSMALSLLFQKLSTIKALLHSDNISTGQMIKLAQTLTPNELIKVIAQRDKAGKSPLPYFSMQAYRNFLKYSGLSEGAPFNYLAFKRHYADPDKLMQDDVFLSDNYHKWLACQSIATSDYWYLAFIKYQKQTPTYQLAFRTLADIAAQMKISGKALLSILLLAGHFVFNAATKLIPSFLFCIAFIVTTTLIDVYSELAASYLVMNYGLIFPFILPTLLLSLLISHYFELSGQSSLLLTLIFVGYIALVPEVLLKFVGLGSLYAATTAVIMLASFLISTPMNWAEARTFATAALQVFVWADVRFVMDIFKVGMDLLTTLRSSASLTFDAIVPFFTRAWASFTNDGVDMTVDEALQADVEQSILRLHLLDEPSANQKGALLQTLWDKIQADKADLAQGLHKKWNVSGYDEPISFKDVAETPRTNNAEFTPKAPDNRLSFFGLRGNASTAKDLKQHLIQRESEPDLNEMDMTGASLAT